MPVETPGTILIVEDDLSAAIELEKILKELGHETVLSAYSGQDALLIAGTHRPDLVLVDVKLQGKVDGIRAAEIIYDVWKIPVIFTGASPEDEPELMERTNRAGSFGFVTKPFRTSDLHATVLIALQQHRRTRDLFSSNSWFTTVLNSLSDGVIATDTEGAVRFLNPAAESILGRSSAQSIGEPLEAVYPLKQANGEALLQVPLRASLANRQVRSKEIFILRGSDGREIAVEDFSSPILRDGRLVGAVSVFVDATEKVKVESEQRRLQNHLEMLVQFTGEELGQTREELRALSAHLLTAQDEERSRIARDLHDDFAQQTALMSMQLASITASEGALPQHTRDELATLAAQIEALSLSLRQFSHNLHPAVLEDLGLAAALEAAEKEWRQRGMELSVAVHETPAHLPQEVSTAFYRIAQEAISNAARHAPGAPVLLTVAMEAGDLVMRIEDAGPGFIRPRAGSHGIGLLNMHERARLVGGSLSITSELDQGTGITVRLPGRLIASSPPAQGIVLGSLQA